MKETAATATEPPHTSAVAAAAALARIVERGSFSRVADLLVGTGERATLRAAGALAVLAWHSSSSE